ncbi:50S ribosomal protein L13 [Patescibacteria group bacterium]|nr:MAG: 50S ribosomal protein L13 [Patescibacteria group bacterium]
MSNKIKGKKFQVDAAGKAVGRVATEISVFLMGKNEPDYAPHVDKNNRVRVLHAGQVYFSGKKIQQKVYRHHSMHPGGLKEKPAKEVMAAEPEKAIILAVSKMLPKNKMRELRLQRISFK